jgi:hypothetical protein
MVDQKKILNLAEGSFRHVVFSLCAYECVAIASKRFPTLSRLSWRYKWLGPVLVAGLTGHLYRYSRRLEAELLIEIATANSHVGDKVL